LPGLRAFLFTALAATLILAAIWQTRREAPLPYDPADTGGDGLRALVLWLEELGHPVELGIQSPNATRDPGLMIVMPPSTFLPEAARTFVSSATAGRLAAWVEEGGTLVLVGPPPRSALADRFGIFQTESDLDFSGPSQAQPLLPDQPAELDMITPYYRLETGRDRPWVPVVVNSRQELVVGLLPLGKGRVWGLTENFAPTNANLRSDQIAGLIPALLRTVPPGAPAAISLHHLRLNPLQGDASVQTIQDWLYATPMGQAVGVAGLLLLIFLLLQGRRLGPPLPATTANRPRAAAEYVEAIAALQRRARHRRALAQHHAQRLKQAVGRLAHLDAALADEVWLAQLRRHAPLPPARLDEVAQLLAGYAAANQDDELIRLVQATDALLASLPRTAMSFVR
jgi:hypothetical protein